MNLEQAAERIKASIAELNADGRGRFAIKLSNKGMDFMRPLMKQDIFRKPRLFGHVVDNDLFYTGLEYQVVRLEEAVFGILVDEEVEEPIVC